MIKFLGDSAWGQRMILFYISTDTVDVEGWVWLILNLDNGIIWT